jgi:hypothetical protein
MVFLLPVHTRPSFVVIAQPEGLELDELMQQQSDMLARIEEQNLWELDRRVAAALRALRCPPLEASIAVLYVPNECDRCLWVSRLI